MAVIHRWLPCAVCLLLAGALFAPSAAAEMHATGPARLVPASEGQAEQEPAAEPTADPATAPTADPATAPTAEPATAPTGIDAALEEYDPLFDDDPELDEASAVYDPFEAGNRAIYAFNSQVSTYVWSPLATGYRFVVPMPARKAVRRVLDNLNAPIYVANHLLQLNPGCAVETLGAFAMNATFGVGGLFDTASGVGWELTEADFGQTLAVYGAPSGPYLMFPFLGPTTVRDGVGFVVDRGFHPATYFFGIPFQLMGYGGIGFAHLEESIDQLNALEDGAIDPYARLRSAYTQDREQSIQALIEARR